MYIFGRGIVCVFGFCLIPVKGLFYLVSQTCQMCVDRYWNKFSSLKSSGDLLEKKIITPEETLGCPGKNHV